MEENNSFKEIDFCADCNRFEECNSSKYGTELLEQYMIFTELSDSESSLSKKCEEIFKDSDYTFEEVKEFMENKKNNCIYFNNRKDV